LNTPDNAQVIPGVAGTTPSAPAAAEAVVVSIPTAAIAPRVLRRLRVKPSADVASAIWAAAELEMKKAVDRDEWQAALTRRCRAELTPSISNAKMLKSLVADAAAPASAATGGAATGPPPLELIRSVAETCRYHKGRLAALIAEIQSAPSDKTAGSELEPCDAALTLGSPPRPADLDVAAPSAHSGLTGAGGALYTQLVRGNAQLHDSLAAAGAAGLDSGVAVPERSAFGAPPSVPPAAAVPGPAAPVQALSPSVAHSGVASVDASSTTAPGPAAAPAAPTSPAQGASATGAAPAASTSAPGPMVFTAQLPWDDD
jgi:hypothetical protein